jgi:hypothetical protein
MRNRGLLCAAATRTRCASTEAMVRDGASPLLTASSPANITAAKGGADAKAAAGEPCPVSQSRFEAARCGRRLRQSRASEARDVASLLRSAAAVRKASNWGRCGGSEKLQARVRWSSDARPAADTHVSLHAYGAPASRAVPTAGGRYQIAQLHLCDFGECYVRPNST